MNTVSSAKRSKQTRRIWCAVCLVAVFVGLAVLHRPLLRGIGRGLVLDQQPLGVDAVVIFEGDGRYPVAAAMLEDRTAKRILLMESRSTRLTELGITEKQSEVARRKLLELGVAPEEIFVAKGVSERDWRDVHMLRNWLVQHPNSTVVVLVDRFASRRIRYTLDQTLDASDRQRVQVVALHDRRYDESDWWLKRTGWKEVFNAYFDLAYAVCCGEDEIQPPLLDPDEFEQEIARKWKSLQE